MLSGAQMAHTEPSFDRARANLYLYSAKLSPWVCSTTRLRIYQTDHSNHRSQYFQRWSRLAVVCLSVQKVWRDQSARPEAYDQLQRAVESIPYRLNDSNVRHKHMAPSTSYTARKDQNVMARSQADESLENNDTTACGSQISHVSHPI